MCVCALFKIEADEAGGSLAWLLISIFTWKCGHVEICLPVTDTSIYQVSECKELQLHVSSMHTSHHNQRQQTDFPPKKDSSKKTVLESFSQLSGIDEKAKRKRG